MSLGLPVMWLITWQEIGNGQHKRGRMLNNQGHWIKAVLRSYLCGLTISEFHFIGLSLSLDCIYTGGQFSYSHCDLAGDCFTGKTSVLLTVWVLLCCFTVLPHGIITERLKITLQNVLFHHSWLVEWSSYPDRWIPDNLQATTENSSLSCPLSRNRAAPFQLASVKTFVLVLIIMLITLKSYVLNHINLNFWHMTYGFLNAQIRSTWTESVVTACEFSFTHTFMLKTHTSNKNSQL